MEQNPIILKNKIENKNPKKCFFLFKEKIKLKDLGRHLETNERRHRKLQIARLKEGASLQILWILKG